MRFLVFADLQLDRELETDAGGPDHAVRRRANVRACLDRILALADDLDVDAIVSAGDLYVHRHVLPGTASFLVDRLGKAGRPVFLAPGDQDPHTPDSVYATTAWPDNVHVFDCDVLVPVELGPGVRLWGAAHPDHPDRADTPGFLDGFVIADDGVNLAVFHGSEVGSPSEPSTSTVAPFRAEQVEQAGLTHAFVGHAATAVDAPWHTVPGVPDPLGFDDPDPRGAVIVDVDADGTVRRERHSVAVSRLHEVAIDVTGADSADEVIERMLAAVEDLEGVVRVCLEGTAAPGVEVDGDELSSWSTDRLEIRAVPTLRAPVVSLVREPASGVAPTLLEELEDGVLREATAAHDAWQETLDAMRRHASEEPADVARPSLGGQSLNTLEAHLETLKVPAVALDAALNDEVGRLEADAARDVRRRRALALAAAIVAAGVVALGSVATDLVGLQRGLSVAALVVAVVAAVTLRRRPEEDRPELVAAREQLRMGWLRSTGCNEERALARHRVVLALREVGLPTDPGALAQRIEDAHEAALRATARTAWERRRAELAIEEVETTARLRAALTRAGIPEHLDVETAWVHLQAAAGPEPRLRLVDGA